MRRQVKIGVATVAAVLGLSGVVVRSQGQLAGPSRHLAPATQIVAVRAGRLFDARSGNMLTNQVILITGDRIAEVGASVQIPTGATVIDLSGATVLPGMIDAHVHVNGGETPYQRAFHQLTNAQANLEAGFTTVLDMDSRGGFGTVDLRNMINSGHVQGPRMQVTGQSLNQRAGNAYPALLPGFYEGYTENKNINSPWLARAAVREWKLHGVDWIKIYTTQDFVGEHYMFRPDGSGKLIASPSLTSEEVEAIVDEAHRMGLKVACHTYGGEGMMSCLNAGVDAPNHLLELDDAAVKVMVQKKLPYVHTLDDLIGLHEGDLKRTGGKVSRLQMGEQSFKKAVAAGIPIVFGSGAVGGTGARFPNGRQADQFKWYVKWGMTPAQALQVAFLNAANILNYGMGNHVGSLEKGKFADVIAVPGDPLKDITEMERVRFVMKGGMVVRNDIASQRQSTISQ